MADAASDPSSSRSSTGPALQRGRACLRCRKRKMRCDGGKPSCQQCTKAKKGPHCEYDDGKGKTRTQILRENVARLEARVRELECASSTQPSVQLFDPHAFADVTFPDTPAAFAAYSGESSSPSSSGSPSSLPFIAPGTPSPYPFSSSPVSMASGMVSSYSQGTSSPTPSLSTPPARWISTGRTTPDSPARASMSDAVPVELAHTLLDIVIPHAQQIGLVLHPERLRASLHLPYDEQRHPVLLNAIYLWACALSRPQSLSNHEGLYFARAADAFADAPRRLTKVVDVVQGASLLALYLLTSGRLSEGSYYLSAAASLALQWGLHRTSGAVATHESPIALDPAFVLPPPGDTVEAGERALVFWHVFFLDAAWSPALQRPRTIGDAPGALGAVTVPWPQDMADYETASSFNFDFKCNAVEVCCAGQPMLTRAHTQGNYTTLGDGATVRTFLAPQSQVTNFVGGFSPAALRAKAAALLDAATTLSASWDTGLQSMLDEPAQAARVDAFEGVLSAFENALFPLTQLPAVREQDRAALLETHALVAYARIQLHYARAGAGDVRSHEACVHAARAGVYVARAANDAEEADLLDPIVGSCFAACASVLASEISRVEAWVAVGSSDVRAQMATLLGAMSRLNVRFPLVGFQIARIQRMIPVL